MVVLQYLKLSHSWTSLVIPMDYNEAKESSPRITNMSLPLAHKNYSSLDLSD